MGCAAHGGGLPERRGPDVARDPALGNHATVEGRTDRSLEPRKEQSEASTEYDDIEIEKIDDRGERGAEVLSGLGQAGQHAGFTCFRTARELLSEARAALSLNRHPRARRDRLDAGITLETPAGAADTGQSVANRDHVPELTAESVRAAEQVAVHDDAATDPDLPERECEVAHGSRGPQPLLGERCQVRFVLHDHRHVEGQARTDLVRDVHVVPAQVRRAAQELGVALDEARHRDADADH